MKTKTDDQHAVVSPAQWLAARRELLREEKALTRERDRLAEKRRALPWVKMEKTYTFDSASGPVSLADLFGDRSQLVVQHFMLGPGWEEGCKSCSFMTDHFNAAAVHLPARDVSFAAISRASLAEILAFKERMGWNVKEAAEACGVGVQSWRNWEAGRSPRGFDGIARQIAEATGCNYLWLLAGEAAVPRSRCFTALSLVKDTDGQMELAFDDPPELQPVR